MPFSRLRTLFGSLAGIRTSLDALVQASANQQSLTSHAIEVIAAGFSSQQTQLAESRATREASLDALLQELVHQRSMLAQVIDLTAGQNRSLRDIAETQRLLLAKLDRPKEIGRPTSYADKLQFAGYATIRDFLDADEIAELAAVVNEVYRLMDHPEHFDGMAPDFEENYRRWFGVWLEQLPNYLASASPELARRYGRILQLIEGRTRYHLGACWAFYPSRSYFRRHIGTAKAVPWHIDADAAGVAREECFNVWLPLDAVGRDLPTLEIVPRSHVKMRAIPLMPEDEKYRDEQFVATMGTSHLPVLDPGDALLFDQYTLHRTQRTGPHNMVRTACEFRFELAA